MRKLGIILPLLLATVSLSAQKIENAGSVEPVKYEKRDGKLKILSYVKLDKAPKAEVKLRLNNEPVVCEISPKADSLLFWLPMIGKNNVLTAYMGKVKVSDYNIDSPINSDWGYFANGTIHIIQSSHQDIGWMDTPEYCRTERIKDIITPALDMMNEDPEFTFEMEQTLNLMEYLEAHPERKDEIIKRYKEGRFLWGATYNQPYEGLSSGEQLVRQTYYGRKWIKENLPGCDDLTANNIDVPGRTMQMPQIFEKSGIKNLFISRMGEGLYNWYSPDGSKVFTYTPGNYGWAALKWKFFDQDAVFAMNKLHDRVALWQEYFRSRNIPPHYAVLMSCDATKPVNFRTIINEWNTIVDMAEVSLPRLTNSTAEAYFHIVNTPSANLETVSGERPDLWLYIHGPAHYQQTVSKREAGVTLPAAEMFYTISGYHAGKLAEYPRASFDRAWIASIYPDHGLGGKNGDITDAVFSDSLKVAQQMGEQLLGKALSQITSNVATQKGNVVVYNDLTWPRTDIVAYQTDDSNVVISELSGKVVPSQFVTKGGSKYVVFIADNVPSVGYKTYKVTSAKKPAGSATPKGVTAGDNYCENQFYRVVLGNGGVTSLVDKSLNRDIVQNEKFACGDILDVLYKGNGAGEFNRVADVDVADFTMLSSNKANWKLIASGALCSTYENVTATKNAKIIQYVTVYHQIKKIDFDVTLEGFNGAQNRQYRIMFPLDMKTANSAINYEVPMGVAQVGRDEMKTKPRGWSWEGTYVHNPVDTHPREIQNFISANGNGFGVTMSSCVAVADWIDPSRESADYPVLQGILLSSHKSCHGLGNWYHQTGTHNFSFSLLAHNEGWTNGYQYGIAANHPLRVTVKTNDGGSEAAEKSFVAVSDPMVAITTIKRADNDNNIILRLTEMEGKDKSVTVTLPFDVKRVVRTNLIEDEQQDMKLSGRKLTFNIGHHAIETFKIII